jgi:hypothetical protein
MISKQFKKEGQGINFDSLLSELSNNFIYFVELNSNTYSYIIEKYKLLIPILEELDNKLKDLEQYKIVFNKSKIEHKNIYSFLSVLKYKERLEEICKPEYKQEEVKTFIDSLVEFNDEVFIKEIIRVVDGISRTVKNLIKGCSDYVTNGFIGDNLVNPNILPMPELVRIDKKCDKFISTCSKLIIPEETIITQLDLMMSVVEGVDNNTPKKGFRQTFNKPSPDKLSITGLLQESVKQLYLLAPSIIYNEYFLASKDKKLELCKTSVSLTLVKLLFEIMKNISEKLDHSKVNFKPETFTKITQNLLTSIKKKHEFSKEDNERFDTILNKMTKYKEFDEKFGKAKQDA